MLESENLAGWLLLSCLSMFIAVMIVAGCVLGLYTAEARTYTQRTGEHNTMFDEIWSDFGPRKQIVKRNKPIGATTAAPTK